MSPTYRLPPVSNGCEIHHDCLTCPLEMCVFEMPGGIEAYKKSQKYEAINEKRSEVGSIRKTAKELGVSTRVVIRAGKQAGAG